MLTRRDVLKAGLMLGGAMLIPGARRASASPPLAPFVDPLPIPSVLAPRTGVVPGAHFYEIGMREFTQKLHRDLPPTTLWGYQGLYPGPTIEAQRNVPVFVRWVNELRDPSGALRSTHYLPVDLHPHGPHTAGATPRTVVHLHGGKVPPESDGYPDATILPGQRVVYHYPNAQRAATLWYHDHALGITRLNVYMGLAGFYLIRDPAAEGPLNLPSGEFDVPLVIQDRAFHPDGSLDYPAIPYHFGFQGDTILVNGKVWPYLAVKRGKYRFRILNGSNERVYQLELSSGGTMYQIGTEGGLLEAPVPMTQIQLSPAERAEVVIDFAGHSPGDQITLLNTLPAPPEFAVPNVMQFRVGSQAGHQAPLPAVLSTIEFLSEAAAVQIRDVTLDFVPDEVSGIEFVLRDGPHFDWDDISFFPKLGTIEVWQITNMIGAPHPIHLHLVHFQVLDRAPIMDPMMRTPPPPNEVGWKDTVTAFPNQITRIITRFEGYTGLYPYHCHIIEHEDHEMMRQFRVVP